MKSNGSSPTALSLWNPGVPGKPGGPGRPGGPGGPITDGIGIPGGPGGPGLPRIAIPGFPDGPCKQDTLWYKLSTRITHEYKIINV